MNLNTPTLLLDTDRMQRNVVRMLQKAIHNHSLLRPHLKTPQSNAVARLLRAQGIERIAVSSLRMADYYAKDGWNDITVAFPLNILEMNLVNELAQRVNLQLLLDHPNTVEALAKQLKQPVEIMIEVDVGYGRSGVAVENVGFIEELIAAIQKASLLTFRGFLSHAGHTYNCRSREAVQGIFDEHRTKLHQLKSHFQSDFPDLIISYGDTPSCSMLEDLTGFEELRPGNFVFYDLTQEAIGSCTLDDIAVAVLCPVVGLYPMRSEIVVYGGGVHFSKDRLVLKDGQTIFGQVVDWQGDGWRIPNDFSYVRSLSQEHGVIKASPSLLARTHIGDQLAILPVHSCMTVDLMPFYRTLQGEQLPIWDKQ